ncbi:hypothetical protein [Clavibacter zhangzhiyongii]|uniref:Uncharacterized protein n=1 Tax=Clavibacter zhangzhiyongii TaxID=2768071 RepID=A0A7L7YYI4_9MICO|nr:hypothetical protein [Clavibacter zhangzhiyongii]QOD42530.1 hypothetical protein H9X71_07645 [Clavibacter zhangzhiyongii]
MLRLAPHHLLYRVAADEWRHVTPAREFHRVSGPDALVADVARRLAGDGIADPDAPAPASSDDPGTPLVRLLRDRGAAIEGVPDPSRPLPGNAPVSVEGDGPVARALLALLGDRATPLASDAAVPAAACALVSIAPEQPDAAWSARGRELARTGLPWHRVHQEGELLVVGPLQAPGGPGAVAYADYRGRRRAAHRVVEELDRLWREADARAAAGITAPWAWHGVGVGAAAIAAGIVVDELEAHLDPSGGGSPGVRHEHTIALATGLVERHPVLPLPVDLADPPVALATADGLPTAPHLPVAVDR